MVTFDRGVDDPTVRLLWSCSRGQAKLVAQLLVVRQAFKHCTQLAINLFARFPRRDGFMNPRLFERTPKKGVSSFSVQ